MNENAGDENCISKIVVNCPNGALAQLDGESFLDIASSVTEGCYREILARRLVHTAGLISMKQSLSLPALAAIRNFYLNFELIGHDRPLPENGG